MRRDAVRVDGFPFARAPVGNAREGNAAARQAALAGDLDMTDTPAGQSTDTPTRNPGTPEGAFTGMFAGTFTGRFSGAGGRWLRRLGHRGLAPLALLLLSLVVFLPGLVQVPPLDRDEPRFAQASKQMLESRDFVDIRFQEEARHKKPVGIYWLQSAAVEISGLGSNAPIWVYRLPSQLGAVLAVLLTYWCTRAFAGPVISLFAGALTAVTLLLGVEARLAKTDAMLLATILAAQGALARIWLDRAGGWHKGLAAIFWAAMALSVLVKGPVGPLVSGLTLVALCLVGREVRWLKRLYPLPGLALFVLLVLPWFIAIALQSGGAFFAEAVGKDFLAKVGSGQESHGAPPLTHLAAALATFWPLPAFTLLALPMLAGLRRAPAVVFLLCWIVPSWLVFELTATKLPHYTLPLLPAIAILTALLLSRLDEAGEVPGKAWRIGAAALFIIPVAGVAVASLALAPLLGVWPSPPGVVIALIALVPGLAAMRHLARGAAVAALPSALGAAILVIIATWGFTLPGLSPIWISPRLAETVREIAGCDAPQVTNVGFNEPSYIFLQGTDTLPASVKDAAGFLIAGRGAAERGERCRVAVVEGREERNFLDAMAEQGFAGAEPAIRLQGFNINGGKRLDFGIYRAADLSQ